jgi:hypothetical protein
MSDPPIPAPQYTLTEALSVCLAMCHRALTEVRALARVPGPAGEPGPEGKRGLQGERGSQGQKGEPGRNAADLALLQEYIDQRFERMIAGSSVTTPDGGRTLRWALSGRVYEIKTATVLDAGTWKQDAAYVPGDAVTHGGSLFIAKVETTAKPGTDDWRLAAKRGADGRDWRPDEKRAPEPVRFR